MAIASISQGIQFNCIFEGLALKPLKLIMEQWPSG